MSPDKRLAGVCGLFCPACTIYIATTEEPKRLRGIAERKNLSVAQVRCYGCGSDQRYPFCETCVMYRCAGEKRLEFCGECGQYPCRDLQEFKAARPHRIELWESQRMIKEKGFEYWFREMLEHYRCPSCGTLNSAYDLACRNCGVSPSCRYVRLHWDKIAIYLSNEK
jgi:hypothetical protein